MRGERSVKEFSADMLRVLNLPKNTQKGGWVDMSLADLKAKLIEEFSEVMVEVGHVEEGNEYALLDLHNECIDLANVAMMLHDKAEELAMKHAKTLTEGADHERECREAV